ncbi:UNVERIFIED_CONTAM: hypothetical protein HDU68_008329 [Siphonaria sp. JEL0065]|nr:hypothetical protein HDU68_008329 [Siphonaria sp. JEL0065]
MQLFPTVFFIFTVTALASPVRHPIPVPTLSPTTAPLSGTKDLITHTLKYTPTKSPPKRTSISTSIIAGHKPMTTKATKKTITTTGTTGRRAFVHRGFMLDTSRKFFPITSIYRLIDGMAAARMNVFHWHLTDNEGFNVEWSYDNMRLTRLTNNGGYYTHKDLMAVVAYAAARSIEVIPEIDIPGHVGAWGRVYPNLMLAGTNDEFDVSNPAVFPLVATLTKEITPMFSSRSAHFGFDETSNTPAEIAKALNFVENLSITALGKCPVIWDDPITSHGLSPSHNFTVQVWTDMAALSTVLTAGYHTIVSVSSHWYIGNSSPKKFIWPKSDLILGGELAWWTSPSDDPLDIDWVIDLIAEAGVVLWGDGI